MTEIVIGNIIPLVSSVGDDDLLLVWLKQPGVLRLIKSSDYRKRNDVTGVVVIGGLVQANGIQAADGESVRLVNRKGAGITVDTNGVITITPGDGASNRIKVGKDGTVFDPEFLTRTAADSYYIPPFPVAQPNHGFANGNPARWNGTQWVKPGAPGVIPAGATSPADDWSGIVSVTNNDANNFTLYCTGKVTGLTGAGFTPGVNYWNGSAWTTQKPTAFGAYEGKVLATTATDGIVVPFKRRSAGFRPLSSLPTGAGRINVIAVGGLPSNHVLCATQAGTIAAGLFVSTDGGGTWASKFNAPSPFTSITDIAIGAIRTAVGSSTTADRIAISLGFVSPPTGAARAWVYSALNNSGYAFTAVDTAWGSSATRDLNNIEIANGYWWTFHTLGSGSNNVARGVPDNFFTNWALGDTTPQQTIAVGGDVYVAGGDALIRKVATTAAGSVTIGSFTHTLFSGEQIARLAYNNVTMLAATSSGKIFRSDNFTATTPAFVAASIPGVTAVNDLVYSVFAWFAATDDGIYLSTNNGSNWGKIYESNGVAVTALAADGSGKVWAGTADGKFLLYGG